MSTSDNDADDDAVMMRTFGGGCGGPSTGGGGGCQGSIAELYIELRKSILVRFLLFRNAKKLKKRLTK